MLHTLQRAFGMLRAQLRWRWAALLPLVLATAAAEAAGAASVFALLRILTDPGSAAHMPITASLYRLLPARDPQSVVLSFTLFVMVIYICRLGVLAGTSYANQRVAHDSIVQLSSNVLGAYLAAPFGAAALRDSSVMLQRVQRGSEATVTLGFVSVLNLASEVLVMLALILLLVATAPVITLAAVAMTTALLLIPAALTHTTFERWGKQEQELERGLLRHLQQGLGALREIRVQGRSGFFHRRFTAARVALSRVQRRRSTLSDALRFSVETVFVLVLLLMVLGVTWRGRSRDVVSLLGLYAYAGFRFVPSANRITLNVNSLRGALPFARDLYDDTAELRRHAIRTGGDDTIAFTDAIVFTDVTYTYTPGAPPALSGIELRIRRGESVGIVGMTGAGKSTLIDLLLGLLEPSSGHVLVDGRDIQRGLRSWQRQIGYVAQMPFLLDDTIRCNIAFGLEAEAVDEERMHEAVQAAQLAEFIASLPLGLDTPIGERGTRLSGGQRQRIAVARALYARPPVLVFDEATSALDPQTERELTRSIAALQGTRTMVVIAHRIGTLQGCDRLVRLSEGKVSAEGSFSDLLARDPEFRAFVEADGSTWGSTRSG